MNLNNVKLAISPLTGEIYLYRHGKDAVTALDKRNAEKDVMAVLIEHMLHDMPTGAIKRVRFGEHWYDITVKPVYDPERKIK